MPYKCCVPLCKGNYFGNPRVSTFGFPKDKESQQKWLHAINKKNFTPSSKVCELHFQPHEIERVTSMYVEDTGEILTSSLKVPRLIKGAVPSRFPGRAEDPKEKRPKRNCKSVKIIEEKIESKKTTRGRAKKEQAAAKNSDGSGAKDSDSSDDDIFIEKLRTLYKKEEKENNSKNNKSNTIKSLSENDKFENLEEKFEKLLEEYEDLKNKSINLDTEIKILEKSNIDLKEKIFTVSYV